MKTDKTYCCIGLEAKILNHNQKGFSIIFENNNVNFVFNAVDTNKEEILLQTFREKLIGLKLPSLGLNGKIQIKYCPFCGYKISEKIFK